jgi:small subunit ribosomal protein S3
MGQKTNPIGFRTGITEGWKSRWYAPKAAYGEFLVEDARIRDFIDERLNRRPPYAAVSKVEIERTRNDVKVYIHTARPGVVIGPRGAEVDRLKDALENLVDRQINLNVVEVKNPDVNAQLVAEGIAEQLQKRRWPERKRRPWVRFLCRPCRPMWTMGWLRAAPPMAQSA